MGTKNQNGIGETGQNVAANVRRLRMGQRITTTKFAGLLGDAGRFIRASGVTKLEGCYRKVDVDDLTVLAHVLKVDPVALLAATPVCATCENSPPAGFSCRSCGAEG